MEKKTCFLLVFHGSRNRETLNYAQHLHEQICKNTANLLVEIAFLQFSDPSLSEMLNKLNGRSIAKIFVVPMLLLPGIHSEKDIPDIIEDFRHKAPQVAVEMLPVLGMATTFPSFIGQICQHKAQETNL